MQIKHGEAAYPRDAWVELQYSRRKSIAEGLSKEREVIATERLPPHMTGLSPSPGIYWVYVIMYSSGYF